MSERIRLGSLHIAPQLYRFISDEVLPESGLSASKVWNALELVVLEFTPEIDALLAERKRLERALDAYHEAHPGPVTEPASYRAFLEQTGYLVPPPTVFRVETVGIDEELTNQAGPQLVVPLSNPRYAINAMNARWGSLYDALYGSDVLPAAVEAPRAGTYDPSRGAQVVAHVGALLDAVVPLTEGSHTAVTRYALADRTLVTELAGGRRVALRSPEQFVGHTGPKERPSGIILRHHGLHIELCFDPDTVVGRAHPAGLCDVRLEAALTTILDLEDAVAAVDAEDKVSAYRTLLGIFRGTLTAEVNKNGVTFTRSLHRDRMLYGPDDEVLWLRGRSLAFVRNVGLHLTNSAILVGAAQREIYEGLLDAVLTVAIAHRDACERYAPGSAQLRNSCTGSIYVVKPKLHGPAEVAATDRLFGRIEQLLALPNGTVKLGIMDEERRTSVNLAACIAAARERVVFINTGFLDRTGDEIRCAMNAGPVRRKGDMRNSAWLTAYERRNVLLGLRAGLARRGQIGKGMWPAPDLLADMVASKGAQLVAGASTAWVPSPSAATLHALHYHLHDVNALQAVHARAASSDEAETLLEGLLTMPVVEAPQWTHRERLEELDNNVQSILGYVVHWVDRGVGCSKVPDLCNVGLMEDRATLRISSQHIANWLRHGIVSESEVRNSFARMAQVVDRQNTELPGYAPLATNQAGEAYRAALELVFEGAGRPHGYTESVLHTMRRARKARIGASHD